MLLKKRGFDSKNAQMKMSFGMIFSIILIVIFIATAFYAITKFLDIGNSAQITKSVDSLQSDIDKVWGGSQGNQEQEYFFPSKIDYLCFMDAAPGNGKGVNEEFFDELEFYSSNDENLFFYPPKSSGNLNSKEMNHIDIVKTTETENPLCIENIKGKVTLSIKNDLLKKVLQSLKRR